MVAKIIEARIKIARRELNYVSNRAIFRATNTNRYNLDNLRYGIIESVGNSEYNFTKIETVNTTIVGKGGAGATYGSDGA